MPVCFDSVCGTMRTHRIVRSAFQPFLQTRRPDLSRHPLLLVSNSDERAVGPSAINAHAEEKESDEAVKKVRFLTTQALGLRCVPATISSRFPTLSDVDTSTNLMQRSGASQIIGTGDSAAVGLARISSTTNSTVRETILMPTTVSSLFECCTSHSLLLDVHEETIVAKRHDREGSVETIVVDVTSIASLESDVTKFALEALRLDSLLVGGNGHDTKQGVEVDTDENNGGVDAVDQMVHLGRGLSFGEDISPRSALVATAVSLMPTVFPTTSLFTLWASLLPGLQYVTVGESDNTGNIPTDSLLPKLASLAITPQTVDQMLQTIRENRASWGQVLDVDDAVLEAILQYSLNR